MDNRLGAYVALESAAPLRTSAAGPAARFAAVAAVQEEIGLFGARTAAFEVRPDLAVAVDVTHATDAPGVDEKELGSHPLGSGPVIGRGSTLSPKVFELLVETAEAEGIEYSISASGRGTSTDADVAPDLPLGHPHRPRLDPAALHALAGRDGRPARRRGDGRAARRLRARALDADARPQPLSRRPGPDAQSTSCSSFGSAAEVAVGRPR